jgi:hypothetical protein
MIGVGLDLTAPPYNLNIGTRDYYGNASKDALCVVLQDRAAAAAWFRFT